MECMLLNCDKLISVNGFKNFRNIRITKANEIFFKCKSLISLPDIDTINTTFLSDLSLMFYNCNSLKALKRN